MVLKNVVEQAQTVCERRGYNRNSLQTSWTGYELSGPARTEGWLQNFEPAKKKLSGSHLIASPFGNTFKDLVRTRLV